MASPRGWSEIQKDWTEKNTSMRLQIHWIEGQGDLPLVVDKAKLESGQFLALLVDGRHVVFLFHGGSQSKNVKGYLVDESKTYEVSSIDSTLFHNMFVPEERKKAFPRLFEKLLTSHKESTSHTVDFHQLLDELLKTNLTSIGRPTAKIPTSPLKGATTSSSTSEPSVNDSASSSGATTATREPSVNAAPSEVPRLRYMSTLRLPVTAPAVAATTPTTPHLRYTSIVRLPVTSRPKPAELQLVTMTQLPS
jgi:hypothetical protein